MLTREQIEQITKNGISVLKKNADASLTVEEQAVYFIHEDLQDIKNKFVDIAFRLAEADNYRYYEKFGYENIVEFSEHLFGIKKSSTYSLLHIGKYFCSGMHLKKQYEGFSKSQLEELTRMPGFLVSNVKPEMTVQDIRDYKKALHGNTYYKNIYQDKPFEIIKAYREDQQFQTSGKDDGVSIVEVEESKQVVTQVEEPKKTITDKDVSDCLKRIDKLIKPDRKTRLERLMSRRTYFKDTVSALLEKQYNSYYVEIKMGGRKQNLSVFLGCLAGNVFDIIETLIKE